MRIGIRVYGRLLSYMGRRWPLFLLGVLGTTAASGAAAAFVWFLKPLLDQGFIARNVVFMHWAPFLVIFGFIVLGLSSFVGDYFVYWTARYVIMQLQKALFQSLLYLPTSFFDEHPSGQVVGTMIYNVEQVANASSSALMTILCGTTYVIALLITMFINSWLLALIFLAAFPMAVYVIRLASVYLCRVSMRIQHAVARVTHITEETVFGHHTVRNYGAGPYECQKFEQAVQKVRRRQMKTVVANTIGSVGSRLVISLAIAFSIYLATSPHHALSAGTLFSTIAAMFSVLKPIKSLTKINVDIQKGIAGAESVFAIVDQSLEHDTGTHDITAIQHTIRFDHVHFQYPRAHTAILTDVSFHIRAGQTIALVGASGSGKTTLMHLLLRFYNPTHGKIYLDGVSTQDITLSSLRKTAIIVPQHVMLFNDTIARNIVYNRTADLSTIQKAAQAAQLHTFIDALPQGYDTPIGHNGISLSAGQRQRIGIARALLAQPSLLILDEAMTAIDETTAQAIYENIRKLLPNATLLLITHRHSLITHADQLLVLANGKIQSTNP